MQDPEKGASQNLWDCVFFYLQRREMNEIKIDSEFKSLIPPLTSDEYSGLEESILAEGCRDALVLWGDTLIDGHNRYEICQKYGIPYDTTEMELRNRDEAKLWIYKNQLSRRNLNDIHRIEMTHKIEGVVKAMAEDRMKAGKADPCVNLRKGRASEELGAMAGVSGTTYEHGVAILENAPKAVVDAVKSEELSINAGYQVTKLEPEEQKEIAWRIENTEDEPKAIVQGVLKRPHVSFNSGNNEWYTPAEFIESAREVMGSIDLDPASNDIANQVVKAEKYYTAETNGLDKTWRGNVWMNPPYASELIGKFVDKLVAERSNYEQAIVLVNNATETEWFNKIISVSSAVCFPKSRVKFYMPDGKTGAPLQGQAVLYIGKNTQRFTDSFQKMGWVAIVHGLFGE